MLNDDVVSVEQGNKLKAAYRENSVDSSAHILKLLATKPSSLAGTNPLEKTEVRGFIHVCTWGDVTYVLI